MTTMTCHSASRVARLVRVFYALPVAVIALLAPIQNPAIAAACSGKDMLAELQSENPEEYRAILEQADATENARNVLWKLERGSSPPSWLFGTIHITDPRVTTLSPAVHAALDRATTIALEIADLSSASKAEAIANSARLVVFTDGRRLDRMLTKQQFDKVRQVLTHSGLPVEAAATFRPWIVTMLLSVSNCERNRVQGGKRVLDMQIAKQARKRAHPVIGLETVGEQLTALAEIPEDQQLAMLQAALKYADRIDDQMETMVQLYLSRRMGAALPFQKSLARRAGLPDDTYTGFQNRLLTVRNRAMRDRALPYLAKGGLFMAVGALHLPGNEGLVDLLRREGYTVTAVE